MEWIKNFLAHLSMVFYPKYWLQNHTYSREVDRWFIESLKNPQFSKGLMPQYVVELNGKIIWIANRPYGLEVSGRDLRPSRLTMKKFYRAYDNWLMFGDKNA